MKNSTLLFSALTLGCVLLNTGCSTIKPTSDDWELYWRDELRIYPKAPTKEERNNKELNSSNPKDYILPDGRGIAIPSIISYEYYISPFAPKAGYVQSRKPAGSEIVCPYTGKILILGDRAIVAEKSL